VSAILKFEPKNAVTVLTLNGPEKLTRRVESFAKSVIAAVNGLALGGGCELAEACHIALAAERARFSKAEINIGIIPTCGGTQRLPTNVGRNAALELIISGREFNAAEAARLGLVNCVVPASDLLEAALSLASDVSNKPHLSVTVALAAVHRGMDAAIDDGLAIEDAAFAHIVSTYDANEGVAAFAEKRSPTLLGRWLVPTPTTGKPGLTPRR
jgi:enoyl-CoA hydratase/carnithine racemase